MTSINVNYYLEQFQAPAVLERIARLCKFCLRQRALLVPTLLRAMEVTRSMKLPVYAVISMPCNWRKSIRFPTNPFIINCAKRALPYL